MENERKIHKHTQMQRGIVNLCLSVSLSPARPIASRSSVCEGLSDGTDLIVINFLAPCPRPVKNATVRHGARAEQRRTKRKASVFCSRGRLVFCFTVNGGSFRVNES